MPQTSLFLLSIDQISNTDDLQKKSKQILPSQLVFTCYLCVFFTCNDEFLFDLIRENVEMRKLALFVNKNSEYEILGQ